jgi:hypothetical protein
MWGSKTLGGEVKLMPENNTNIETKKTHVPNETKSTSLKGTLLFTMFVGLFIVVTWSAMFFLFLNRM